MLIGGHDDRGDLRGIPGRWPARSLSRARGSVAPRVGKDRGLHLGRAVPELGRSQQDAVAVVLARRRGRRAVAQSPWASRYTESWPQWRIQGLSAPGRRGHTRLRDGRAAGGSAGRQPRGLSIVLGQSSWPYPARRACAPALTWPKGLTLGPKTQVGPTA